jgi:hypothetical protein
MKRWTSSSMIDVAPTNAALAAKVTHSSRSA